MRSFDVVFDLHLNQRLSKQSWGWWFETPSRSLRRHCNGCPWTSFLAMTLKPYQRDWTHRHRTDIGVQCIPYHIIIDWCLGGASQCAGVADWTWRLISIRELVPDSKIHGANMDPIWGRQDPGGPHVGPVNFVIWGVTINGQCHLGGHYRNYNSETLSLYVLVILYVLDFVRYEE